MILTSLLIPFILFPVIRTMFPINETLKNKENRKKIFGGIIALAIPYIVIGSGLAWFNYVRFGSITEFGSTYQITAENMPLMTQSGILGNIRRAFDGMFSYLLTPFTIIPRFPFIASASSPNVFTGYTHNLPVIGALIFPVTWFLPVIYYVRKNETIKKASHLITGMLTVSLLLLLATSVLIGMLFRYSTDFYWLIILSALFVPVLLYVEAFKANKTTGTIVRRLFYVAAGSTSILLFLWGFGSTWEGSIFHFHPIIIRYLADLFSII